uniref:Trichohyalin-like n=1 Tax=Salarias fasciatus TaxID=181472 RepID=A0A672GFQ6_SALFA
MLLLVCELKTADCLDVLRNNHSWKIPRLLQLHDFNLMFFCAVRFEVVTSEASYCHSLDIVVEHFVKSKQLGSLLTTQDRNWLFSRLADVRAISHSFLSKLEERVESDMMHFTVCDIIARNCPRFKMVYVPYLTNQSYQDATYQRLMNENPGFKRIVEKLERSPVCQRLPLRSFLVLPFQRITRIKLLVQNIVKRTTPGTPEATHAIKALKLVEKLIQESNDSITQMKSIESLVSLNAKVDFACRTLPLISQSRRLVREGPVTELMDFSLKETERNVYMHLFNDYLLLSLQKEGGRFTVIDHAPVSDLQTQTLRWISALSRPHPEIDFSAAQGTYPALNVIM